MRTNRFTRLLTRTAGATVVASFVALASASPAVAQSGTIRGAVTRADTRTPIMGARVSITNPERVAISDERGGFTLRDLPPGTYSIFTSAIGKKPDSSSVTVAANRDATLNIGLKDGSLLLSSVVVSATRTPVEANKVASTVNVLTPEAGSPKPGP